MKRTTNINNRSDALPFSTQVVSDDGLPDSRMPISADICLISIGAALLLASAYKLILKICRSFVPSDNK